MTVLQPFKWHSQVWKKMILSAISDCFSLKEINSIKRSGVEIYSDDISNLGKWYFQKSGNYIQFDTWMAQILQNKFSGVQCYHCCRPADVSSYLENGIMPLRIQSAIEFARRVFISESPEPVTEEVFNIAVNEVKIDTREGISYFGIDDRTLIRDCGHYLLYGSEYVCGIAARLTRFQFGAYDYRQLLKNYGIPTVFTCNIPFSLIPEETILELSRKIVCHLFGPESEEPFIREIDFSIWISCPLPPEYIIGYYRPTKIRDPLTNQLWHKRNRAS